MMKSQNDCLWRYFNLLIEMNSSSVRITFTETFMRLNFRIAQTKIRYEESLTNDSTSLIVFNHYRETLGLISLGISDTFSLALYPRLNEL